MTTLYLRLFSKATADSAEHWSALPCRYAIAGDGGARNTVEREGLAPLADLADIVARAQRVILILAASDVTLLPVKVPPMSPSRLKAALPNLVEEQLISDPADCALVAGPARDGVRTVAIVQRAWLEILNSTLESLGARQVIAVPAQLCLPYQPGLVSAAVTEQPTDVDVTVRSSEQEGIGLPIWPDSEETLTHDVLQALLAVVAEEPITLYVAPGAVPAYREAAQAAGLSEERIGIFDDDWMRWIAAANQHQIDLMPGLGRSSSQQFNWRPWRWPIALAGALVAVNVAAVNIDWWRMKNQADTLRADMTQIYRNAYPQDTVIVDPLAQMQQKIGAAKNQAGELAPDDFGALAAAFGEAWNKARPTSSQSENPIAALEYRDRSLFVSLKPGTDAPTEAVQQALAAHNLSLNTTSSQNDGITWEIRSRK